MSYYDDYIAGGLCCEACGALLDGDEPGFSRFCNGCKPSNLSARIGHDFGDYAELIVRKSNNRGRGRQPVRDTPLPSDSK